jgi:8-oxo-dGTP pyrophosphatase MutT (NUDIX family)
MKEVSLCVLKKDDFYLLVLRDDKPEIDHPNHWSLVGGGIEPYENPREAIAREIEEEISCSELFSLEYIDKIEVRNTPLCKDHDIFLFKAEIKKEINELKLTEGQKLRYFKFDEILDLKFPNFLKDYLISNKKKFE